MDRNRSYCPFLSPPLTVRYCKFIQCNTEEQDETLKIQ
nr:MAG TPA: hypothetical protein [Caudoviricetes sp.]